MTLRLLAVSLLLPSLLCAGCAVAKRVSPREAFLKSVPNPNAYAKLYEVSPEILRDKEETLLRRTKALIKGVRALSTNEINSAMLANGLERMEEIAGLFYEGDMEVIEALEKDYNPETDVMLFFHFWPRDDAQETGYVIIRDGKVFKKLNL